MLIFIIIIILIVIILLVITSLINKRKLDRIKLSIYECGNQEFEDTSKQFYIKYYKIGIAYLVFDIEILILYPIIKEINNINISSYIYLIIIMLLISLGLYYELKNNVF